MALSGEAERQASTVERRKTTYQYER